MEWNQVFIGCRKYMTYTNYLQDNHGFSNEQVTPHSEAPCGTWKRLITSVLDRDSGEVLSTRTPQIF